MDRNSTFSVYTSNITSKASITKGSDGNVWFIESGPSKSMLTKITHEGIITEIPLSGVHLGNSLVEGPDGNFWFTGYADSIVRVTKTGVATQFNISGSMLNIIKGANNDLWFTEINELTRLGQ